MEAYCLSVPAGSTSREVQPLLQGLKSRTSKSSSPPQAPVLPPAGITCECQTTSLSLTFLIWETGPRVTTVERWVWSTKKRYLSFSSPGLIFTWSRGPHCLVCGWGVGFLHVTSIYWAFILCQVCIKPVRVQGDAGEIRDEGVRSQSSELLLLLFFNQYIIISLSTCPCQDEYCFRGKKNCLLRQKYVFLVIWFQDVFSFSSFYDHITI